MAHYSFPLTAIIGNMPGFERGGIRSDSTCNKPRWG